MKKKLCLALSGALCLSAGVGCGTETAEETLTPVRLNEVVHSVFYAPQYVAQELGFFEEEGLDVSVAVGNGADPVALFEKNKGKLCKQTQIARRLICPAHLLRLRAKGLVEKLSLADQIHFFLHQRRIFCAVRRKGSKADQNIDQTFGKIFFQNGRAALENGQLDQGIELAERRKQQG